VAISLLAEVLAKMQTSQSLLCQILDMSVQALPMTTLQPFSRLPGTDRYRQE
jgi:hypothetical protein